MKILYSAFACNPYIGSEAQCGWAWAMAMREINDVYIITRKENRESIEKYMKENGVENITVFYYDIPDCINPYYKFRKFYFLYYYLWQRSAVKYVKKLNSKYHFDYIHHITLGDFRLIGGMWKINTRFIFGPVGGAQITPRVFDKYVYNHRKEEKIRKLINWLVIHSPAYRKAANNCYCILAANKESQKYIQRVLRNPEKCKLLTENGIFKKYLNEEFTKNIEKYRVNSITILWAGRLIYRKGLDFLLESLKLVKTNINFKVKIVGDGPEREILLKKRSELGLDDVVDFIGKVKYEDMKKIYKEADIFVFPSLRETTGTVLFEAMANHLPIISFNQNGASLLIENDCGLLVNLEDDLDTVKMNFAMSIVQLIENHELRKKMGNNAYMKLREKYSWEYKVRSMNNYFIIGN